MTETAIDSGLFRDLYVSLGEPVGGGAWSVRVYYKPFVGWIWGGAVLMALGGGLAVSDRRYALAARKEREARQAVKPEEVPRTVAASVANPSYPCNLWLKNAALLNSTRFISRSRRLSGDRAYA